MKIKRTISVDVEIDEPGPHDEDVLKSELTSQIQLVLEDTTMEDQLYARLCVLLEYGPIIVVTVDEPR